MQGEREGAQVIVRPPWEVLTIFLMFVYNPIAFQRANVVVLVVTIGGGRKLIINDDNGEPSSSADQLCDLGKSI